MNDQDQTEEFLASKSQSVTRPNRPARLGGIVMLVLVCVGLICVAWLQRFRENKSAAVLEIQTTAPVVAALEPSWHLLLKDVPERKAFIGFRYGDHIYVDASELCVQPGFREHADSGLGIAFSNRLLSEAPDILLPGELAQRTWWVISNEAPPEERVFDTPYQWLGSPSPPYNYACLFLGKKTGKETVLTFSTEESEPVIVLMDFETPLDLHLKAQEGWTEVTDKNRIATLRQLPWLHSWMNKFGGKGDELCGYAEGEALRVELLPIKARMSLDAQRDEHWLVATGCDVLNRWSLVMTNEDGTVSFIALPPPIDVEGYRPVKVWTVDIDNDGMPEFLVQCQHYEGSSYALLRLSKNDKGGYFFTEIAGTSYEGV